MLSYLAKRILYVLPVAFGVSLFCFLLVHIAPGDPLTSVLPPDASRTIRTSCARFWLLRPGLPVQFGLWLMKALQGDLGTSIATGRPEIATRSALRRQHAADRRAGDRHRLSGPAASSVSSPAISAAPISTSSPRCWPCSASLCRITGWAW